MSQLLLRLSKLPPRNHSLMRLFSTSPYLPLGCFENDSPAPGGGNYTGDVLLFDAAKEEVFTISDKTIPKELANAEVMGASHGWLFYSDRHDRSLCITDLFNPLASKSNPQIIPLPHPTALHLCQTDIVWNVAMSSPPPPHDDEQDWVVAISFLGDQLSLCRPRRDLRWTNFSTPFRFSHNSNLMFSKRDQTFYMPAPGGNCLCSWNLLDPHPKFHELVFHYHPEMPQFVWELLDLCHREDHWVESPSGESFLVKWYSPTEGKVPILLVFREEQDSKDGKRHMRFTDDIGDLCIFLSQSEAFCLLASSCPGLQPNSIYLMGRVFAVYDIAAQTPRLFEHPKGAPEKLLFIPYWLPPFSA